MCIRDSYSTYEQENESVRTPRKKVMILGGGPNRIGQGIDCLLYTSDAADERSSVDLGGRRIIKKKKVEDKLGKPIV